MTNMMQEARTYSRDIDKILCVALGLGLDVSFEDGGDVLIEGRRFKSDDNGEIVEVS